VKWQGVRRGDMVVWLWCCMLSWCSLWSKEVGDVGVSAVAAALVRVPRLQELR
jgi:hypothetical protein